MSLDARTRLAAQLRSPRAVVLLTALLALACGAGTCWSGRYFVTPHDGVAYLSLGRAASEGRWADFVNSYWSPVYPLLIGIALRVAEPGLENLYPLVNAVQFFTYFLAWLAMWFFLRELIAYRRLVRQRTAAKFIALNDATLQILGWLLLVYVALIQCGINSSGPNILFIAAVLAPCGQLLRIKRRGASYRGFTALALIVAAGYYCKTPALPVGLVVLACAAVEIWPARLHWRQALLAGVVLAGAMLPWLVAMHSKIGYWTIGDTARLNHAIYVTRQTTHMHGHLLWRDPQRAVHPTRSLATRPRVMEFAEPIHGTYPVWVDPAYWQAGFKPRGNWRAQLRAIDRNTMKLWHEVRGLPETACLVIFLLLLAQSAWQRQLRFYLAGWAAYWFLIVATAAGLGMFIIVLVMSRHVAPFLLVGMVTWLAGLRLPDEGKNRRWLWVIALVLGVCFAASIWRPCGRFARMAAELTILSPRGLGLAQQQALAAQSLGLKPGTKLCSLKDKKGEAYSIAALCECQVVTEIRAEEAAEFWALSEPEQEELFHELRRFDVEFLLAPKPADGALPSRWHSLGEQSLMMLRDLRKAPATHTEARESASFVRARDRFPP